ncbi:MAG: tRNA (N(6)-L-threonylcarbamoyladenosine(37)-C(2))-methylthiotransferase MtaB, partial [Bacteroidales bacterium]|nr:tRNA (N(6)-L-threonylcarbamoyladenosine(37)-C(2))-methylthiotransferase MtaB [Bacteroidales bacterium]
HIFPYSRRANTVAAALPDQVKDSVKTDRVNRLEALCERLHSEYCGSFAGKPEKVLFESTLKGGMMVGYTRNYIRVVRPYDKSAIGKIVDVVV